MMDIFVSAKLPSYFFFHLKISHHFPLFIIFLLSVTAKIRCRVGLVKYTIFVNHSLASLSLFIDELLNGGCRFGQSSDHSCTGHMSSIDNSNRFKCRYNTKNKHQDKTSDINEICFLKALKFMTILPRGANWDISLYAFAVIADGHFY